MPAQNLISQKGAKNMVFSEDVQHFRQTVEAKVTRRSVWAMSLVLIVMSLMLVLSEAAHQKGHEIISIYASSINIAGRQRMLSQRIAYFSEVIVTSDSRAVRLNATFELRNAAEEMREQRDMLLSQASLSAQLSAVYFESPIRLQDRVNAYIDSALMLAGANLASAGTDNIDYQAIASTASPLLNDLEATVSLYEHELIRILDMLAESERGRILLAIGGLALAGTFVLWPGARAVTRYVYMLYERITMLRQQITLLEERQMFIDSMIASLPSPIAVYDIQTAKTVFMNERYRQMLGYDKTDDAALDLYHVTSIIHPQDVERAQSCMHKAADTGTDTLGDYRLRHKDGRYITVESRAAAVRQRDQIIQPPQLISVLRVLDHGEVSTELEAIHAHALLTNLSALIRDKLFIFNRATGHPLYLSPQLSSALGYSSVEIKAMIGKGLVNLIVHPDDIGVVPLGQPVIDAMQDGMIHERMIRLKHKDGHWMPFFMRLTAQTRDDYGMPQILTGVCIDLQNA